MVLHRVTPSGGAGAVFYGLHLVGTAATATGLGWTYTVTVTMLTHMYRFSACTLQFTQPTAIVQQLASNQYFVQRGSNGAASINIQLVERWIYTLDSRQPSQ
jgi:hypothetical protein